MAVFPCPDPVSTLPKHVNFHEMAGQSDNLKMHKYICRTIILDILLVILIHFFFTVNQWETRVHLIQGLTSNKTPITILVSAVEKHYNWNIKTFLTARNLINNFVALLQVMPYLQVTTMYYFYLYFFFGYK